MVAKLAKYLGCHVEDLLNHFSNMAGRTDTYKKRSSIFGKRKMGKYIFIFTMRMGKQFLIMENLQGRKQIYITKR